MDDAFETRRDERRIDFETESQSLYTLYIDERYTNLIAVRLLRYSLETRAGPFPHVADLAISGYAAELPRVGAGLQVSRNWNQTDVLRTSKVIAVGKRQEQGIQLASRCVRFRTRT
jgi:hypothetical protein